MTSRRQLAYGGTDRKNLCTSTGADAACILDYLASRNCAGFSLLAQSKKRCSPLSISTRPVVAFPCAITQRTAAGLSAPAFKTRVAEHRCRRERTGECSQQVRDRCNMFFFLGYRMVLLFPLAFDYCATSEDLHDVFTLREDTDCDTYDMIRFHLIHCCCSCCLCSMLISFQAATVD
jgi:hypothetical protein